MHPLQNVRDLCAAEVRGAAAEIDPAQFYQRRCVAREALHHVFVQAHGPGITGVHRSQSHRALTVEKALYPLARCRGHAVHKRLRHRRGGPLPGEDRLPRHRRLLGLGDIRFRSQQAVLNPANGQFGHVQHTLVRLGQPAVPPGFRLRQRLLLRALPQSRQARFQPSCVPDGQLGADGGSTRRHVLHAPPHAVPALPVRRQVQISEGQALGTAFPLGDKTTRVLDLPRVNSRHERAVKPRGQLRPGFVELRQVVVEILSVASVATPQFGGFDGADETGHIQGAGLERRHAERDGVTAFAVHLNAHPNGGGNCRRHGREPEYDSEGRPATHGRFGQLGRLRQLGRFGQFGQLRRLLVFGARRPGHRNRHGGKRLFGHDLLRSGPQVAVIRNCSGRGLQVVPHGFRGRVTVLGVPGKRATDDAGHVRESAKDGGREADLRGAFHTLLHGPTRGVLVFRKRGIRTFATEGLVQAQPDGIHV